MPGQRLASLNDVGVLAFAETLVNAQRAFDDGWSEDFFNGIGHDPIRLCAHNCSRTSKSTRFGGCRQPFWFWRRLNRAAPGSPASPGREDPVFLRQADGIQE